MDENCLPIDDAMIKRYIASTKAEFNEDLTTDDARAELETLKSRGCLLYDDCRDCPLFNKKCPL